MQPCHHLVAAELAWGCLDHPGNKALDAPSVHISTALTLDPLDRLVLQLKPRNSSPESELAPWRL